MSNPKLFVNYSCTGCQQALARIGRNKDGSVAVDPSGSPVPNKFRDHVEIVALGNPQFDFYGMMTVPTLIMDPPDFVPRTEPNHEAAKANARRAPRVSGGMAILGALQARYSPQVMEPSGYARRGR